jgi:DNA primase
VARIPDDVLDAVRRSTDLAELVGRHVPLRKSGKSFSGRCPFHQEKSPSFFVWPESGIWKCFGCGEAGNAFTFLMKREGLSFLDAVRQLAREHGIALPDDDDPEAAARAARLEELRRVTEWACRHFEAMLRARGPEGERARTYFKGRGIRGETARDFRLGYAPPGWDRLLLAAREEGIPEALLLEAGLVIAREGRSGVYDRFRDRVVFPIADAQGRVIAFGARTLGDDEPKYLNSPETPLFTKGKNLYAFHLAKQEMMRSGEAAVMEGYTDVILAHQSGYRVAVAGLGTALTADQARRLAQYAKKLWLVYDGDAAGLRAAEKAIPAFLPEPIETRVCVLPGEKDPADVFVEDGAEAFRASLAQSREAFDHLLWARAAANDVETVPGKTAAIEECLAALVPVGDEIRRALYLKRLSDEYGVPEEVVSRKLRELRLRARPDDGSAHRGGPQARPAGPRTAAPSASAQPGHGPEEPWHVPPGALDGEDETGHGAVHASGAPAGVSEAGVPAAPPPPDPAKIPVPAVERQLLEAFLGAPALVDEAPPWLLEGLSHPWTRRLAELLLEAREAAGGPPDPDRLLGTLGDPAFASFAADLRASGQGKRLAEQGRDCLVRLGRHHEERRLRDALHGTDSEAEEADVLRRLQDHHRRRAGGPGPGDPGRKSG